MVVPRSAVCVLIKHASARRLTSTLVHSALASDEDYTLFTVIIFRKVYDTFAQKCRENKCEIHSRLSYSVYSSLPSQRYILRDFLYSSDQIDKEREELQIADTAEKELWVSSTAPNHPTGDYILIEHRRSSFGFRKSTFPRLSKFLCTSRWFDRM